MVVDHSGIYRVHMLASTLARGRGRLRLHCLLAHCGHMFNPRKGCWRAMQDAIGAGQCLADLPLRYQRTHPVLMTHHERPISRDTMKEFGGLQPTGATACLGFERSSNPIFLDYCRYVAAVRNARRL